MATTRTKLSYNNAVKKGLQQSTNRTKPAPKPANKPLDPVSWGKAYQDTSDWFDPPQDLNWQWEHWADGPKELVIYWEQGVYDALHGKEPAPLASFFDKLERGLLPSQQVPEETPDAAKAEQPKADGWNTMQVDIEAWEIQEPSPNNADPGQPSPAGDQWVVPPYDPWTPARPSDPWSPQDLNDPWAQGDGGRDGQETNGDGWHQVNSKRQSMPKFRSSKQGGGGGRRASRR